MNLVKKYLFFCCILPFWSCHTQLKTVETSSLQVVSNGQYPIKMEIPPSAASFTFFKVHDKRTQKVYPAQKLNDSTLVLLVQSSNFTLSEDLKVQSSNTPFYTNTITVKKSTGALMVANKNQPILNYQITEQLPQGKKAHYRRGGFIHPLYSPNGKIITDDFPEGHTHQHAIFFAFVNTTYKGEKLDFWNQHQATGTIEFDQLVSIESGPVFGRFKTSQNHVSVKHGTILKENWEVIIYNTEPYIIDIQTTLQSIAPDTLFINDYHYGGMAFRGTKAWNAVDSLHFQQEPSFYTNENKDRPAANHSRPLWSAMIGDIDGEKAGVAIVGHPTNFRYPEPIRIHPSMPYFCVAPMVGQPFVIPPDGIFKAAYTYMSFDGEVPIEDLNKYADFLKSTIPE